MCADRGVIDWGSDCFQDWRRLPATGFLQIKSGYIKATNRTIRHLPSMQSHGERRNVEKVLLNKCSATEAITEAKRKTEEARTYVTIYRGLSNSSIS